MPTKVCKMSKDEVHQTTKDSSCDDELNKSLDLVLAQLCTLDKALESQTKNDRNDKRNSGLKNHEKKIITDKHHRNAESLSKIAMKSQRNRRLKQKHTIKVDKLITDQKKKKSIEDKRGGSKCCKPAPGPETTNRSVNGGVVVSDMLAVHDQSENQSSSKHRKVKRLKERHAVFRNRSSDSSLRCNSIGENLLRCKIEGSNENVYDSNYEEEALRRNLSFMSFTSSSETHPNSISRTSGSVIMRGRSVSGDGEGCTVISIPDINENIVEKQVSEYQVYNDLRVTRGTLSQGRVSSAIDADNTCDSTSVDTEAKFKNGSLEDLYHLNREHVKRNNDEKVVHDLVTKVKARQDSEGKMSKPRKPDSIVEVQINQASAKSLGANAVTVKREKHDERRRRRVAKDNRPVPDMAGSPRSTRLNGISLSSEFDAKMRLSTRSKKDALTIIRSDHIGEKDGSKPNTEYARVDKRKDKSSHRLSRKEKRHNHECKKTSSDEGLPRSPPQVIPISPAYSSKQNRLQEYALSPKRSSKRISSPMRLERDLETPNNQEFRKHVDYKARSTRDKSCPKDSPKQKGSRIANSLKWHTEVQPAQVKLRPDRRSTKQSIVPKDFGRNGMLTADRQHKSKSSSRSSAYTSCSSVSDSFSDSCSSKLSSSSDCDDFKYRPHLRDTRSLKSCHGVSRNNSGVREKPTRAEARGNAPSNSTTDYREQSGKNKQKESSTTTYNRRKRPESKSSSSSPPKKSEPKFDHRRKTRETRTANKELSSKWHHHRLVVVSQKPTAEFLGKKPHVAKTPPPIKRRVSPQQKTSSSDDADKRSPTIRDLYSLQNVLSDTQNGTVISGYRRSDGMRVAIKRISKSATTRWGWLGGKVVPLELALLCQVNEVRCSGVVDIVEWHETTEAFLLVMVRPHPAVDLYDYVSKHKRVKESLARHIIRQLITALQHCINHGVLHRDIKLENILLNPETMEITLIDFGCGDYVRSAPYKEFAGTPEYYAPEWFIHKQYYGEALTVWSIGVLFYSLICGSLPFRSAKDITEKEITKFSNDISRNARDLITCLLLKNPRDRLKLGAVLFHLFFQQERNSRDAA